jgi:hypothetical protein
MTSSFDIAKEISLAPGVIRKNFVAPRRFSGPYLLYRVARPVLKLNYKIFKWRNPITPWTSQAAVRIFEKLLNRQMKGFEYGSGNSTLFFAQHLEHLTSVEHNPAWFNQISGKLNEMKLGNVDYHHIPTDKEVNTDQYSFYDDYQLTAADFQVRQEYHSYFSFVCRYPDQHFDFMMVDGRARVECCLNAIPKLKSGGIFVLDNSDRQRYAPVFRVLSPWPMIHTTTGYFDTTFWFKP